MAIINAELELFNLKIQYPSPFLIPKNSFPPSPLYLTDETYLIEIMELVSGMFLSKRGVTHTGVVSPLTEIGRAFEYLFNIKLGNIHKKHESVIKRKPAKVTEFLDMLRKVIQEESKNKGFVNQLYSNYLWGCTSGTPLTYLHPFAELCFINRLKILMFN